MNKLIVELLHVWSNDVWTIYTLAHEPRNRIRCLVLVDSHEQWAPGEVRKLDIEYILANCVKIT